MHKGLIERLAYEAGILDALHQEERHEGPGIGLFLERFTALFAEECAKVAESAPDEVGNEGGQVDASKYGAARAIRAKFGTPLSLDIVSNPNVPPGEAEVRQGGKILGRITGIGEDGKG